jgi:hypothetical protein
VLLLGFEIDQDVHFRLYRDPVDIEYRSEYQHIYWFPGTRSEVLTAAALESYTVNEVLKDTLWHLVEK